MKIEKVLGYTREGGSCSHKNCNNDYVGHDVSEFYPDSHIGYRVLAEIEPGIVEPQNICSACLDKEIEREER